ncbi:MAG TPA: TonB-dependent receptor [Bacteroidota bacterium]|nr:TonB-dependent receptor [Bacteroidota bacterium]
MSLRNRSGRPYVLPVRPLLLTLIVTLHLTAAAVTAPGGALRGKVTDSRSGAPLPYVNIMIVGTTLGAASTEDGSYLIGGIPPGVYDVQASLIGYEPEVRPGITIDADRESSMDFTLKESSVSIDEVVVYGASLRKERLTEAPSAVSVIEPAQIKLLGGSGQAPKLLETQPGVDIVQSGLHDFNVNTRGFNSSLNRRLIVLLDGRDLAIAFLGAQEWNGLSVPVEDLGKIELIRGPSSALYGANAFNGVINIMSEPPHEIAGTKLTLAGGEREYFRTDLRYAAARGIWSYKMNLGRSQGKSRSVDRKNLNFEYDGFTILNNEEASLIPGRVASSYGSLRIDRDLRGGAVATVEGGLTQVENEVFVTGIGRVQVPKALKPWGRINYSNTNFYAQLWVAGRDSRDPQLSLSSGLPLIEKSAISQAEVQYRTGLGDGERFYIITGASFRYQNINTRGTLMREEHADNMTGVYSQIEYTAAPALKFTGAVRWDRSTLHDARFSPKFAAVWSADNNHTFRATFNQAFQAPNHSELFLYVMRTATNPYTSLKSYFAYHGNEALKVEKITGFELGYKGILEKSLFVTVDGYYNILRDFITDLAPGVHPNYPEPVILPGDSVLRAIWSYNNAGKVTERGAEVALNYYAGDSWIFDANYAWFDFSVIEKSSKDILIPNAPKNKVNAGITYRGTAGLSVNLSVKYVPSFNWAAGIYQGRIYAYTLVNLAAAYRFTQNISAGINLTNLLDREHYEIFGGSLIGRMAIGSVTLTF